MLVVLPCARVLDQDAPYRVAGGAEKVREETRARIRDKAVSIWLKADADIIMKRVRRRSDRPFPLPFALS